MGALKCYLVLTSYLGIAVSPALQETITSIGHLSSLDIIVAAIESNFQSGVKHETVDAQGLMQLTPIAIKELQRVRRLLPPYCAVPEPLNLMDDAANLVLGHCYLWYLDNVQLYNEIESVTGYNGGGYAVDRLRKVRTLSKETANYIVKYVQLRALCPAP